MRRIGQVDLESSTRCRNYAAVCQCSDGDFSLLLTKWRRRWREYLSPNELRDLRDLLSRVLRETKALPESEVPRADER